MLNLDSNFWKLKLSLKKRYFTVVICWTIYRVSPQLSFHNSSFKLYIGFQTFYLRIWIQREKAIFLSFIHSHSNKATFRWIPICEWVLLLLLFGLFICSEMMSMYKFIIGILLISYNMLCKLMKWELNKYFIGIKRTKRPKMIAEKQKHYRIQYMYSLNLNIYFQ